MTAYGGGSGLADRVAIVTGGGTRVVEGLDIVGTGRAAAELFAREGARVLVVDLSEDAAQRTVEIIEAAGGTAAGHVADVTDQAQSEAMVGAAMDRWGRLDVLDNNVGIGSRGSVVDESLERWNRVMNVNVTAMMLTSKFAIPAMIASGDGGAIVNISSISALRPRGLTAYSTSKGAVLALTAAMAVDHAPDGVRVNAIAPGPIFTPMVAAGGMSDEARELRRRAAPLGTEGSAWDIAEAAVFLCSDRARWITGQTLVVDGGVTLASPSRDPGRGA